jgi:hypothetical protein
MQFDPARIEVACRQVFGQRIEICGLHDLTPGSENHVLSLDVIGAGGGAAQRLILKLYSGGETAAANETRLCRALRAHDFPAPEILHHEPDPAVLGLPFCLMPRLVRQGGIDVRSPDRTRSGLGHRAQQWGLGAR